MLRSHAQSFIRCRALRLLVDERADLVMRRTQMITRLKAYAQVWLDAPISYSLTTGRGRTRLAAAIAAAGLEPTVAGVLERALEEITHLSDRIAALEAAIAEAVAPLAPNLLAVPGIGAMGAATLLGEIGDITRFASSARLARYTGCAPIPMFSADKPRHRLHRGGNRRLNSLLYYTALSQARCHGPAQALLKRLEPVKGTKGARRVLKRHLIDVIYKAMATDRTQWQHPVITSQPAT